MGIISPVIACMPFLCGSETSVELPAELPIQIELPDGESPAPVSVMSPPPSSCSVDVTNVESFSETTEFAHKIQHSLSPVLHLTAFGDWGNPAQPMLVRKIGRYLGLKESRAELDAVILLGDNFYPKGVASHTDLLWRLFTHGLAKRVTKPFYALLGNHDVWGNRTAQVTYDHPLWHTHTQNFLVEYVSEGFTTCVWMMHYDMTTAEWIIALGNSLAEHAARCHWRIIATHVPAVTGGVYKNTPEVTFMMNGLSPLLNAYDIHLHISGHEHTSQVLRRSLNPGTLFLIAGATADDRYQGRVIDHQQANVVWVNTFDFPAVLDLSATATELTVVFVAIEDEDDILFATTIRRRIVVE
jgi:tartrate-resistant acid phosphatase type 5